MVVIVLVFIVVVVQLWDFVLEAIIVATGWVFVRRRYWFILIFKSTPVQIIGTLPIQFSVLFFEFPYPDTLRPCQT